MTISYSIKQTDDYALFKLFEKNRLTSDTHVKRLQEDPKFPAKFPTCPIVVDANYHIIDGQHRYKAAMSLGIPIFYIMDKEGMEDDICNRNANILSWSGLDYLKFYSSKDKPAYQFIKKNMEKHACKLTFFLVVGAESENLSPQKFGRAFKDGKMKISYENDIQNFSDTYIPFIKEVRARRGKIPSNPLFTKEYISAFYRFMKEDFRKYEKVLGRLLMHDVELPYYHCKKRALEFVRKIIKWKARPSI